MVKVDYRELIIEPHNIVVAYTTKPDYEMYRYILLKYGYDKFVILEGGHCSCYDFDETAWEAIEYTREELKKLANAKYNQNHEFWRQVRIHV